MKRLLVVYNTCGIKPSSQQNLPYYFESINNILGQDLDGIHVVLSGCAHQAHIAQQIKDTLQQKISYNFIPEVLPVNVTFNDTVLQCIEAFGEFEGYMYVDSGIDFQRQHNVLNALYSLMKSGPYGMVAARADSDTGFSTWYKTSDLGQNLFDEGPLIVDIGKAVNLHVQIFHNDLQSFYGRLIPDIFAGQCTESTFSFMCAALKMLWIVHPLVVHHHTAMDGPSMGFRPPPTSWEHAFGTTEKIVDIINRGVPYGMGYEELRQIAMHNPEKFDENLFATDVNLKHYIRDNLFLSREQFNYDAINREFTP